MCTVELQMLCICIYVIGWFIAFYIVARDRHETNIKYIVYTASATIAVAFAIVLILNFNCPMPYLKWGAATAGVLFCLLVFEFCSYITI